ASEVCRSLPRRTLRLPGRMSAASRFCRHWPGRPAFGRMPTRTSGPPLSWPAIPTNTHSRQKRRPIMKALQIGLGLLIGFGIAIPGLPTTAQAASPKETQTPAAGLRTLTPEDARRTLEREKAGIMARGVDRWDEAIARAQALLAVQARRLGPRHFEAVN